MTATPPKTSIAGGAKYHAIAATQKWEDFVAGIQSTVTHTAAERADRDREAHNRALRHEAQRP